MNRIQAVFTLFLGVYLALSPVSAQSLDQILATFEVHPGFEIELVAMEPVVTDPVDLEFDEHGRAYVIEMPGYPYPEKGGKVVQLMDEDDDGIYETRKEFAGEFPIADSIMPYKGGLLVASPPDLLFLRDLNGDGLADIRTTILTGFASRNQQHNFNGLTYGLDNWVYGANGGNSGSVYLPGNEDSKMPLRWNDFRFHWENRKVERYGRTTGGFEISFDPFGRYFATHNLTHISHLVFPGKYVDGLPVHEDRSLHWGIFENTEDGLARIYPIGEQETRVNHPEQSGYFSGACGIRVYTGDAFGSEFENNVFVCDVVLNLVNRNIVEPKGASFTAKRARKNVEFLASRDRSFRPVNLTVGPDGALYVVDMYREVIEHPEWIPDEIEQNLDLDAGKDKGRIFRITPKGGLPKAKPQFSRDDIEGAVQAFEHPNKWWRDTAQRLIIDWQQPDEFLQVWDAGGAAPLSAQQVAPPLRKMLTDSDKPHARLHALWTLHHSGVLREHELLTTLADTDAGVRENAVQVAGLVNDLSSAVFDALVALTEDPAPRVRMYAALVLGEKNAGQEALYAQAIRDAGDRWTRMALFSAFANAPATALRHLLANDAWPDSAGAPELTTNLTELAASRGTPIGQLLIAAAGQPKALHQAILEGLSDGMPSAGKPDLTGEARMALDASTTSDDASVARSAWQIARRLGLETSAAQLAMLEKARTKVMNRDLPKGERLEALGLYEFAPFEQREDTLFKLLDPVHPTELQLAAVDQLEDVGTNEVARRILDTWNALSPAARIAASDVLLYKRHNHDLLLGAMESGRLPIGQLNMHLERRRVLLRSPNKDIAERAKALFSDAGVVTRQQALAKMRPALQLDGNPENGKQIFADLCMKCHQIGGEGGQVGPALDDIARKSKETLLHDIVDPNAAVDTEYLSYTIETKGEDAFGGEIVSGMVVAETDDAVTVRAAEQEDRTILRSDIKSISSSGLSMMPEELEAGMTPQDMADLLAFLQQEK